MSPRIYDIPITLVTFSNDVKRTRLLCNVSDLLCSAHLTKVNGLRGWRVI